MKTLPRKRHSTYSLSQFFSRLGILLLFSLTIVIGDPCPYNSKTVIKKVSGDETTYMASVGQPLELFCSLSADYNTNRINLTSKNLLFQRDSDEIAEKYVEEVNETTIRLKLENKEVSNSKYYCYLNIPKESNEIGADSLDNLVISKNRSTRLEDMRIPYPDSADRDTVCWNTVEIVGVPKKAENISCTVYNLQELNCTWDVPLNDFQTNYTIRYEPVSSKYGGIEAFACPNDDDEHNNTCKWTLSTEPPYRKDFEKLKVIVTGVNMFNKINKTSIVFDQFSIVRAKGPENLKLVGKTPTSIKLEWSIGEMQYFPKPWTYRIRYKTIKSDWSKWLILGSKNVTTNGEKVSYNVTNLTPGTMYDFQVFMKPHRANDNYWSKGYAGKVFKTEKL